MHQDRRGVEVMEQVSLLTPHDVYLFNEGTQFRLYDKLGAHTVRAQGVEGTYFAVWAPNAERVRWTISSALFSLPCRFSKSARLMNDWPAFCPVAPWPPPATMK